MRERSLNDRFIELEDRMISVESLTRYDVLFLVGYDSEECMFSINGRYSQFLPSKEQFIEECEVVGNQWDNPELMSEVEK